MDQIEEAAKIAHAHTFISSLERGYQTQHFYFGIMGEKMTEQIRRMMFSGIQAYLVGLTFALAASPCSTPVLATLLAYVASSKDLIIGCSLLLTYTTGYVVPLLLAASFSGALQSLLSFREFSAWINPMSGALLLGGGIYTLLTKTFPATTMSM